MSFVFKLKENQGCLQLGVDFFDSNMLTFVALVIEFSEQQSNKLTFTYLEKNEKMKTFQAKSYNSVKDWNFLEIIS